MNILILIFLHLFSFIYCFSQEVQVKFHAVWQKEAIKIKQKYKFHEDSISLSMLKFYVSNPVFYKKGKIVESQQKYFLLDLEQSFMIPMDSVQSKFDGIGFQIGVDSLSNVSGAKSGALDPILGMYWTWQSGYIDIKLEGILYSNNQTQAFQYHLGGYAFPNQTLQTLYFPVKKKKMLINLDLYSFFNSFQIKEMHTIMSPSPKAVHLAKLFKTVFKLNS